MTGKIVSPDFHRSGVSKSKGGKISYPEVETGREAKLSKNEKKCFEPVACFRGRSVEKNIKKC